jgi:hypothetical protein
LEGCTLRMKTSSVITSSSEVTEVIKKAKTLIDKEKIGELTPQREDQLSAALKSKEHRGRT